MAHKSWQELLDFLTLKARKDYILDDVTNHPGLGFVQICLRQGYYRDKLLEWITHSLKDGVYKKSASKSSELRKLGNEKFQAKNDNASLSFYTESIRLAPDNSEELPLALANRSAVLYHKQLYQECLRDTDLALKKGFPLHLQYKIFLRQRQCFLKLGEFNKARETLYLADRSMHHIEKMIEKSKLDSLKQEIKTAMAEATCQSKTCKEPENSTIQLPNPTYGENKLFHHASEALELKWSKEMGRHVVTNRDVKMGDVLFVEKPYAFVVLPHQYSVHCHHCCKVMQSSIPCWDCSQALYCGDPCRLESWHCYHRWECHGGLCLLHSVGIAHLGLRVVLQTGRPDTLRAWLEQLKAAPGPHINCYGEGQDLYPAVYHLLPHLNNMVTEDLFAYAITAALLTLYLIHHTDYFSPDCKEVDWIAVGELILRHIAQLVCNASAMLKLETTGYDGEGDVITETQIRLATAIYPAASMLNHSCDPNIINSFMNQYMIIRACKDIPKGRNVSNCYGPNYRRTGLEERQIALQSQYFFTCTCEACSQPHLQNFQERFKAFLCPLCKGPLDKQRAGLVPSRLVCGVCGNTQSMDKYVQSAIKAANLYEEGRALLELMDVGGALIKFEACLKLRRKCLHKHNRDLNTCMDSIARCYASAKEYGRSVDMLLLCLPTIEDQFGTDSIEVAHELQKLSDIMVIELQISDMQMSDQFRKKHKRAMECVARIKQILELNYGEWNAGLQEAVKKECTLKEILPNEKEEVIKSQ